MAWGGEEDGEEEKGLREKEGERGAKGGKSRHRGEEGGQTSDG